MSNIFELERRLMSGAAVQEEELDQWIMLSDVSNAGAYFEGCTRIKEVLASVRGSCDIIVTKYLNNPKVEEVPLRRKTKFCLVLNNFSLYAPVRPAVFESLEKLTNIFESSIKQEGAMPFDSELGRMSEHVLVLLMRVMNYTLKASAVHEFAEGNTQFAIQLLLAILLKEPPYEFELRCNCISGLLGSTQPQAFFAAGQGIEEHSCQKFTEKIDFMLNLMLRLQATQVVSDVLTDALANSEKPQLIVQRGVNNLMRTIMSIFKFCSQGATQWRQHILLSTTFLDGTVMMYAQGLAANLQAAMAVTPPSISSDLLHSLNLTFKFGAFATYHLGHAASEIRVFCTFFHDLLQISILPIVRDARLSGQFMVMYSNLFQFMCNVNAFAGEAEVDASDLLPELASAALQKSVEAFLKKEVAACGLPFLQAWHQQFQRVDADSLLDKDCVTYQIIDGFFTTMAQQLQSQQPAPVAAAPAASTRLLGEMPSLKPKPSTKVSIEKAAAPVKVQQKPAAARPKTTTAQGVDASLLCALTGNVMKNPVTSPYGNTFEREAILGWLEQNGSICPITGKPLTAAQLTSNAGVATRIMQQVVMQTMAAQPQGGDDDLYNF